MAKGILKLKKIIEIEMEMEIEVDKSMTIQETEDHVIVNATLFPERLVEKSRDTHFIPVRLDILADD